MKPERRFKTYLVVMQGGLPLDIKSLQRRDETKLLFSNLDVTEIRCGRSGFVQIIRILSNERVEIVWLQRLISILRPSAKQVSSLAFVPALVEETS